MDKFKKITCTLLFLGLIPFSCYRDKYPYYQIDHIEIKAYKDHQLSEPVLQSDSLITDTTYFKFNFDGINIAFYTPSINFCNQTYAFKKPDNGGRGLKDKIAGILFYSDKLFNGRPSGSSLNDLLICNGTIEEWRHLMNKNSPFYFNANAYSPIKIKLTQRPLDSLKHNFILEFTFESGTKKTAASTVCWKARP